MMDKALSRRRFLCISRPRHIEKHSAKALFDAELRAFCSAKRLPGDACGTGWFQRLFQVFQGLAARQLPPLHARCKPRPDFAPALIAAKPGKPCDGGVFRAFCPLLKKEWKRADSPAPPFTGPRLRAHGQPSIGPLPGFHGPDAVADLGAAARRPKDLKLQGKSLCRCLSASFPRPSFAPGLIAAKPEKPCDGGVFGVFHLLLKKERNAASRTLVWLRMGLLRFKRGIAWAHRLGALLSRSNRAHRLGSQPGQTAKRQVARAGATKPRLKPGRARLSLPPALRKLSPVSLPL